MSGAGLRAGLRAVDPEAAESAEMAAKQRAENERKAPPRGSPEAARWIEARLGWTQLGVTIERVEVDGHEKTSSVAIYTNTGRCLLLTVTELFSRVNSQATFAAGLLYPAPALKQDLLNEVAGAILGLASIREMHSALDEAISWGAAYLMTASVQAYNDAVNQSTAKERYETLRDLSQEWRVKELAPPATVLRRESDKGLLVVRGWFHHEVRTHLSGDRGLSAQRIATLMGRAGWKRPAATHWKVAARDGANVASIAVYLVPADWHEGALADVLGGGDEPT